MEDALQSAHPLAGAPGGLEPSYLRLHRSGELARRGHEAWESQHACRLCPHECGRDRLAGRLGTCRAPAQPTVASWNLHRGEEPPFSGSRGSGTIFFAGCNGRCLFCQNYSISQMGVGQSVTVQRLAGYMLELQARGAHNINLVTPSHYVAAILRAVDEAARCGLRLPILYNSSGYDALQSLRWLDGVVDIYLPDSKYADDSVARRLSGFPSYTAANRAALQEMARQVGTGLTLDANGIAVRGLAIRHLVLPDGLSQTPDVLTWLAANLSPDVHISLMSQYFPTYRAGEVPSLRRKVTTEEMNEATEAFFAAGLSQGWIQDTDEDA